MASRSPCETEGNVLNCIFDERIAFWGNNAKQSVEVDSISTYFIKQISFKEQALFDWAGPSVVASMLARPVSMVQILFAKVQCIPCTCRYIVECQCNQALLAGMKPRGVN